MSMSRIARTLMMLVLATPLAAVAASSDKPDFKEADADGNGKVTVSEAAKAGVPKDEAKREDIDDDGKLTRADWKFVDMQSDDQTGSGSS